MAASVEALKLQRPHRFTQGKFIETYNLLDLAIDGPGFFTLADKHRRVYSRAGEFCLDKDGYITDNFGRFLEVLEVLNKRLI